MHLMIYTSGTPCTKQPTALSFTFQQQPRHMMGNHNMASCLNSKLMEWDLESLSKTEGYQFLIKSPYSHIYTPCKWRLIQHTSFVPVFFRGKSGFIRLFTFHILRSNIEGYLQVVMSLLIFFPLTDSSPDEKNPYMNSNRNSKLFQIS